MAQIPTSSITMAAIKAETGASATGTLAACKNASIAFTMTSTSVPGHTRDGNEQTNTTASPWYNTMAEWAGYTHTQDFSTPTYHTRVGATTSAYALRVFSSHVASEAEAAGGVYIFQREISGDTVFQAEVVLTIEAGVSSQAFDSAHWYNSGGSAATFGSHLNHSSPVSIITIADVTGIDATLVAAPQQYYSHTSYPIGGQDVHASMAALSGFVGNDWDGETDGPLGGYGATASAASGGGFPQIQQAYTDWTISISKDGYNPLTLTTFSSWSKNIATSEN
jgi:hypothetical protein